ncbi:MAG: SAM-dependent methyltransferase [Chloroflexota bacterium]|nr:SAM-dependent methyltransferase [Chloroflexota bacterium]
MKTNKVDPGSFRDPSGFVFVHDDSVFRQVNQFGKGDYELLMRSGLYDKLIDEGLLIPHKEVKIAPPKPDIAYKILQPERIQFISYPYEWCFSQLKQAGLTTLKIQRLALESNISLKDCSAYNIQFHNSKAVLIDSLSFEAYKEGEPWTAYQQFCKHFLAPLALMAYKGIWINSLFRVHLDGIPLDLASKYLSGRSRLNPSITMHIHLHANVIKRYEDKTDKSSRNSHKMSKTSLLGLVESLQRAVEKMSLKPTTSEWSDYYQCTNYTQPGINAKSEHIKELTNRLKPAAVWDIGANTGLFSQIPSKNGINTIAFDSDPFAIELFYRDVVARDDKYLLPLVMDITNPSPPLGWSNRERSSWIERGPVDLLMALALIHHLSIGNNTPLESIAKLFSQLGHWLIIEYIPKHDSQVQRMLSFRKDIFHEYSQDSFERSFSEYFSIVEKKPITDSSRSIYLMKNESLI